MNNTTLISKALDNPDSLTETENNKIADLLNSFPYFVPARYAATASEYRQNPSPETLYNTKALYVTNWLLFNEYLKITPAARPETVVEQSQPEIVTACQLVDDEIPVEETDKEEIIPQAETEETKNIEAETTTESVKGQTEEEIIKPVYTEDYFLHQGVKINDDIPGDLDKTKNAEEDPKSLMVMMSFSEWLLYFKKKKLKEAEEEEDRKALKTMWQKEKLAAALEEEGDEIPEEVFKMAVDSIAKEDNLVSESLAEIHYKQGRHDKAIEMYRKLSLRNPGKKVYFARKIDEILKNKQ